MNSKLISATRGRMCGLGAFGVLAILALLFLPTGCGSPSKPNIELRKQNQDLRDQISQLSTQRNADEATIHGYQSKQPTTQSLPIEKIDKLFTTHDITIGKLTGDDFWAKPGESGLKVYVVPVDEDGTTIKASGSFKVEAFDLADPNHPLLGTWDFTTEQARSAFYAHVSLYTYVLSCPWKTPPTHAELTIKVTFTDELTGRIFTKQSEAKINLKPTTRPAT